MRKEDIEILKSEARSMKLVHTSGTGPGYTRKLKGKHFIFFDTKGKKITDDEEIKRIRSLVIPPAWTNVWICPKSNGHLQATGVDAAGRKQYKYHPQWSAKRNEHKHDRIVEFAKALPMVRKKIEEDILATDFTKEKVVAMAVTVMDKTFIRVGNEAYAKMYGSYGLTSLRNKHIKVTGNKMNIAFRGKKGVFQEIVLTHRRLARMMNKLKDIPGQELFQYYDKDGIKRTIDSGCVNEYIESATGTDFTAKDFRTWSGTVEAFGFLAEQALKEEQSSPEKTIVAAFDYVAGKLGNTRAVCKKYYVHPKLINSYREGKLHEYLLKLAEIKRKKTPDIHDAEEKLVIEFLMNEYGNTAKAAA